MYDSRETPVHGSLEAGLRQLAFRHNNMLPGLVVERGRRLRKMTQETTRRLIAELTEHVPIDDSAALRKAIETLGNVELAV
jgi:EAL domain-containing protein (putative c-di-GMP-specific phosphodiesterase class I)